MRLLLGHAELARTGRLASRGFRGPRLRASGAGCAAPGRSRSSIRACTPFSRVGASANGKSDGYNGDEVFEAGEVAGISGAEPRTGARAVAAISRSMTRRLG